MKKNYYSFDFKNNKNINSIYRFLLSGLIIISFFYVMPMFINFSEKNFKHIEFTNNSKKLLQKKLNKENFLEEETSDQAEEIDLLYDILA